MAWVAAAYLPTPHLPVKLSIEHRVARITTGPTEVYGDLRLTHSTRRTSVGRRSGDRLVPVAKSK